MIVPGHADDAITLPLGYGRLSTGHVGRGVGFDAGALRASDAPWFDRGATWPRPARHHRARHHPGPLDDVARRPRHPAAGRGGADRRGAQHAARCSIEELEERRGPQPDDPRARSTTASSSTSGAMAIDLNKCTGCSACVVACQSENNIPVVGKEQRLRAAARCSGSASTATSAARSRSPRWSPSRSRCVHCETAPCEYVCPVNATVHSDEGLNEMVYNRCIGTRYCSNNCPYKVRRFNFLDYTGDVTPRRARWG